MKNRSGCFFYILFMFAFFGYEIAGISGLIFGVLLALIITRIIPQQKSSYSRLIDGKVLEAVTRLSWLTMKADDGISSSELYAFRDFMLQNFGNAATEDANEVMKYLQHEKVSSKEATAIINVKLNYAEKMQILQFLFQLAAVDGEMHSSEYTVLSQIAQEMQILQTDFIYLKNAYDYLYNRRYSQQNYSNQRQYSSNRRSDSIENAYAVLGVKSSDSNEEIKTAYRRLAIANHPDKVQHLGETAHNEAEKRFSKINEAYNRIKKERNI